MHAAAKDIARQKTVMYSRTLRQHDLTGMTDRLRRAPVRHQHRDS